MSKTPVAPTLNEVVTAHNVRKGKQLMRKIVLESIVAVVVSGVVIVIANRMENEEKTAD